ncbi:hypothetical protein CC1G_14429 [Coprinopsis cinerea okayama7|uniref:Uncharacterized protein n=1 Tax=Coprinopsis cinerea (strain Okayama-7 / 130 / ATCC MYA-4618 / FGSC 9003) TaxID=240176 RepID=D6RMB3_COPC7|nr:hypothetical protein CC1G_14429 [Coprinopsis cinerea okayama7\|eukprot:XP_002911432.1 hypothetical protein CC1G_14429 [Coprinopsis cinerea okayama7\
MSGGQRIEDERGNMLQPEVHVKSLDDDSIIIAWTRIHDCGVQSLRVFQNSPISMEKFRIRKYKDKYTLVLGEFNSNCHIYASRGMGGLVGSKGGLLLI